MPHRGEYGEEIGDQSPDGGQAKSPAGAKAAKMEFEKALRRGDKHDESLEQTPHTN